MNNLPNTMDTTAQIQRGYFIATDDLRFLNALKFLLLSMGVNRFSTI